MDFVYQVTHIDENCENGNISPVLDKTAGSWYHNGQSYADEIFFNCIEMFGREKEEAKHGWSDRHVSKTWTEFEIIQLTKTCTMCIVSSLYIV